MTDAQLTELLQAAATVGDSRSFPDERCGGLASLIDTLYEDGYAWRRASLLTENPALALDVALCLIARARTERELAFVGADLVEELVAVGHGDVMEKVIEAMSYAVVCRCLSYCHMQRWPVSAMEQLAARAAALLGVK